MDLAVGAALPLPIDTPTPESRTSNTFRNLKRRLERKVGEAIADYGMIRDGDVVMVCVSGGKDSFSLLSILLALQKRAPVNFRIVAMNLDQKQPGFPDHVLPAYFESIGVEYRIVTENTYKIVKDKIPEGKTTCSLCSRLRRGIIYRTAKELGATKIALGHHRDDMIETLFLNMFFGGKMKAMPPKLVSDDGQNVVIRPLAYCPEKDIERFARGMGYPIIPCNLCGSQENAQRKQIKAMLRDWDARFPGRIVSIATALQNVVPSHLADGKLFDFLNVSCDTKVDQGDLVFDAPELPSVPPAEAAVSLGFLREKSP
ncbi:MAG TPA: tRNA 2-thiocytidine(32) synthetase TtcA [Zoogloea sp.]|uniref:tRNA 2-thiocytidine(32) synthetase TtcA n=1 Tax=Zoogloea sp. TaxID=49181 RepID=UPI002B725FB9|nr:tRNA 2-thiocytidine(32) synthetase TtcA [Zoogloea sp.]HMV18192.1 tRNA 2-thiocytidine(32) synthetase TtcA [Rhodocyclaceae bacterium]HMV63046.1 tRNA 2-thiocytidine(32) synthetase TtcA [Rhodocyclaceae bacterium]HMW51241.1 tRNA 2-thiocytidine(32) synthetase TtcA [Rhodocyclaceae bacterium]HMY48956.1 tRNA 2-thiocytidine(32) synthetase TtcA [Rhodocyclaceae bacterium]HNA68453.1 tRNA 2-thiocytidine(32) synthetase TtcA [Rhodocyclaceae bacterium]